jgi:hypothetical protein
MAAVTLTWKTQIDEFIAETNETEVGLRNALNELTITIQELLLLAMPAQTDPFYKGNLDALQLVRYNPSSGSYVYLYNEAQLVFKPNTPEYIKEIVNKRIELWSKIRTCMFYIHTIGQMNHMFRVLVTTFTNMKWVHLPTITNAITRLLYLKPTKYTDELASIAAFIERIKSLVQNYLPPQYTSMNMPDYKSYNEKLLAFESLIARLSFFKKEEYQRYKEEAAQQQRQVLPEKPSTAAELRASPKSALILHPTMSHKAKASSSVALPSITRILRGGRIITASTRPYLMPSIDTSATEPQRLIGWHPTESPMVLQQPPSQGHFGELRLPSATPIDEMTRTSYDGKIPFRVFSGKLPVRVPSGEFKLPVQMPSGELGLSARILSIKRPFDTPPGVKQPIGAPSRVKLPPRKPSKVKEPFRRASSGKPKSPYRAPSGEEARPSRVAPSDEPKQPPIIPPHKVEQPPIVQPPPAAQPLGEVRPVPIIPQPSVWTPRDYLKMAAAPALALGVIAGDRYLRPSVSTLSSPPLLFPAVTVTESAIVIPTFWSRLFGTTKELSSNALNTAQTHPWLTSAGVLGAAGLAYLYNKQQRPSSSSQLPQRRVLKRKKLKPATSPINAIRQSHKRSSQKPSPHKQKPKKSPLSNKRRR